MFEVLGVTCCLSLSENFHHSSSQSSATAAATLFLEVHVMFMRLSKFIVRSFLNFPIVHISVLSIKTYASLLGYLLFKLCKQFYEVL